MQRRAPTASGLSRIPARLLVLVLCTAAASATLQVLQRPGRAVAGGPVTPSPSSTATDTPTDTPTNTATDTPTDTPVPDTSTPTSTPTDTPVPNTSTPTSTATDTSGPNTATPTPSDTATATPTITPTAEVGDALCSDGIDNNLNGLIDCFDPSCGSAPICAAPAPAMSPVLLLLGTACLTLIGLLQLRRYLR